MSIAGAAKRVAKLLAAGGQRVVFAESCTGGLVSGALTRIPGISAQHCGGMVVYRNATKTAYLGISPQLLKQHGAVSREVAAKMAVQVLKRTPEATASLSVTGHLGPGAPPELDGVVFIAVARRKELRPLVSIHALRCHRDDSRIIRQRWVVEQALDRLARELSTGPDVEVVQARRADRK